LVEVLEDESLNPRACLAMPNLIKKEFQKNCLTEDDKKLDTFKVMKLKKEEIVFKNIDRYEPGAEFGSAWMIKRELLEELKKKDGFYFDEIFLGGFKEDRDLYKRLRLMGYETYRTNKIRCLHVGGLTMSKIPDKKKYTEENRKKFEEKWANNN
jgi:GT2 family glycosyltransferase